MPMLWATEWALGVLISQWEYFLPSQRYQIANKRRAQWKFSGNWKSLYECREGVVTLTSSKAHVSHSEICCLWDFIWSDWKMEQASLDQRLCTECLLAFLDVSLFKQNLIGVLLIECLLRRMGKFDCLFVFPHRLFWVTHYLTEIWPSDLRV